MSDSKEYQKFRLRKNTKTFDFLNDIKKISIFTNTIKESFEHDYQDKVYNNTENNLLPVKNDNTKKNIRRFNLKNYEKIIKKNREKSFLTLKEENNAEIIKNIFDMIKAKKIKRESVINKTIFTSQNKNILTKYKTNNTFTNPDVIRIIPNNIYNNKKIKIFNNLSFEQDFLKTRTIIPKENLFKQNKDQNMTISEKKRKYFDIFSIKTELNNIDKSAKRFNQNFLTKIKFRNKGSVDNKKKLNINIFKSYNNDANDLKYYEDENNKNFIRNKKYFNRYIKKFSHFKYNNNLINKFLDSKKDDMDNITKNLPKMKRKIEENDDEYYYLHEKNRIKKSPILKKIKIIKKRFQEQIDKEIFNIFNKKI